MTMTIQIELQPPLQRQLAALAADRGVSVEQCATELLAQSIPRQRTASEHAELLRQFREEADIVEQKETGDFLIRALDEDRPSNRKLFPPELEGITW
jgi:hypothetical protein